MHVERGEQGGASLPGRVNGDLADASEAASGFEAAVEVARLEGRPGREWCKAKGQAPDARGEPHERTKCRLQIAAYPVRTGQKLKGALSPDLHYTHIRGRAAEIARAAGSPVGGAEQSVPGILHDGGWPVSVISGLVDLAMLEAAVLRIMASPDYSPPPKPKFLLSNGYVRMWGADVAFEMGDSYIGAEHALLAMIRIRETVPARALADLADLDALEAIVLAAKNAPPADTAKMRYFCRTTSNWTARCAGQLPTPCPKTVRSVSAMTRSEPGYR